MIKLRCLILFVLLFFASEGMAQAVFKPINTRAEVGEVPYDSLYTSGVVYYTNLGNAPLYPTKVVTFCPCTTAEFSTEPLVPGDTAQIIITHKLKEVGQFNEAAKIFYFNPDNDETATFVFLSGTAVNKKNLSLNDTVAIQ